MAIYRSDQAQLTFAAEAAQGADPEMAEGSVVSSSPATAVLNQSGGLPAGSRSVPVDGVSNTFVVGDFICIGTVDRSTATSTNQQSEIRRIESMAAAGGTSANTFTLDRPTAFFHRDNQEIKEVDAVGNATVAIGDNNKYLTFIPGIYESVDTPDPEMSIEGRRFLSTQSKRNFSYAYPGQQTLSGSVSGITLLNGWPLRFPIGSVVTSVQTPESRTITLKANDDVAAEYQARKGDVYIELEGGDKAQAAVGDYIIIDDGSTTKSEVRQIVAKPGSADICKLNYPLSFDHEDGASVDVVGAANTYYDHVINEEVDLDTVSWHIHMKDSSETDTKDFDRRYVGGMIGSTTISAEEGGMLAMSWDGVNFLNMVHNQANQKTVGAASGDDYYGASVAANMPRFGLMQTIDTDDIGIPSHNGSSANDGSGYPTTSPYYFSEGTIKFFGQEFARIRSFSLSISNGEEPRYYIGKQGRRARGPFEIREGAREYSMSATVALPDADVIAAATAANADQDSALELFRQLLLEGDYGDGTSGSMFRQGLTSTMKFERGTNDYIIIDIPTSSTAGTPTNSNKLNEQGIFINSAAHDITGDQQLEVDLSMIFRSLKITIRDNVPVYP